MNTAEQLDVQTTEDLREALKLAMALDRKVRETRIEDYYPYPFQMHFHNVKDINDAYARQKFLQAANQVGKTFCAAAEFTYHVTGDYPVWYESHKINHPTLAQVSGVTNETTRDICQAELCGDPEDPEAFGTGAIPKHRLKDPVRKPGIPNALDSIKVLHSKGHWVTVKFRAYEAGFKKFMGHRNDIVWADEEPPPEIWSQMQRSQFARPDSVILATFTPENGVTQLVQQINEDPLPGQGLVIATWDDAPHICDIPGRKEDLLSKLSPHERDMRSKGLPTMGSGLIFPVPDEQIMCDPFEIPDDWPRINGMDFGWDHPTAVAFCAWDRTADTVYVYDEFCQSNCLPPVVASSIKNRGDWIPTIWPHDGMSVGDKQTGKTMRQMYEDEGVSMHETWFTNPPGDGEKEGSGGNAVEPGLLHMLTRMETGRLKVFRTCEQFFREKAIYHRKMKNGQSVIVKLNDDVVSAVRYAVQSLRHSRTKIIHVPQLKKRKGFRNW